MKSKLITLLLAIAVAGIYASCAGDNTKSKGSRVMDELNADDDVISAEDLSINYKVPSPLEMFLRMQDRNVPFSIELLNKKENVVRYVTKYQQAVNLGVYASDMAYCSILGDSQNSLEYFNLVKDIAVEIGLYKGINKDLAERVLNNLTETDTLISVTTDSYHEVINYIEEQGLTDIQCLVVAGAWIESLYLCLEPMKRNASLDDDEMELIQDHQVLLENLIELLSQNRQSGNVAKLLEELELIQSVYDVTYQEEGGVITQKQFVDIVNVVADVRAKVIM